MTEEFISQHPRTDTTPEPSPLPAKGEGIYEAVTP